MAYEVLQELGQFGLVESIDFAIIETDMGDGYDKSALIGSSVGTREWKLKWNVLPQNTNGAITYNNKTYTRADYLWEFYCQRMREGNSSFVIVSPINSQSYLGKFQEKRLSYELFSRKLFSTGLTVKQRREKGVTVFDPLKIPGLWGWYKASSHTLNDNDFVDIISDSSGLNHHLANQNEASKARFKTGQINGKAIFRWESGNSAYYATASGITFRNIFIVAKYSAATFSGNEGLVSDATTNALLAGGGATTTNFFNFAFTGNYEYKKNNLVFAQTAQAAPMNQFGVLNINKDGVVWTKLQLGRDRDFSGRYWLGDVAEIIVTDSQLSKQWIEEINEYLLIEYGLS